MSERESFQTAGSAAAPRFGLVIAGLKAELEHWRKDRISDPDFSDRMIQEINEAIEVLTL